MPIWAVLVLVLVSAAAGWVTGAVHIGTFVYAKLARRVGRCQAEFLLRPDDSD